MHLRLYRLPCLQLFDDEPQGKKFNEKYGLLESTGPPALPQRVLETVALGPGVRGGNWGVVLTFLSSFVKGCEVV